MRLLLTTNMKNKIGYLKYKASCSRGVSLLIAIGLSAVLIFFALLISNVVVSSIRQSSNVVNANKAYYAAEGALEMGLLAKLNTGVGINSNSDTLPIGSSSAAYSIQATVPKNIKYLSGSYENHYSIPTPGTGNAGSNCNPLEPVLSGPYTISGASYDDPADHPCNWNRLYEGENVVIPLYYIDENGDPQNLFTNDNQEFILRMRTPCSNGSEMCASGRETFDFFGGSADPVQPYNDPIVTWSIEGVDEDKKEGIKINA